MTTTNEITINRFALPMEGSPIWCSLEATIRLLRFGCSYGTIEDSDVVALSVRCIASDEVLPLDDMTGEQLDYIMLQINKEDKKVKSGMSRPAAYEKYCHDVCMLFALYQSQYNLAYFGSADSLSAAIRAFAGHDIVEAYLDTGVIDLSLAVRSV